MSDNLKLYWYCDTCLKDGEFEVSGDTSVKRVLTMALDAHKRAENECAQDTMYISCPNFGTKTRVAFDTTNELLKLFQEGPLTS